MVSFRLRSLVFGSKYSRGFRRVVVLYFLLALYFYYSSSVEFMDGRREGELGGRKSRGFVFVFIYF